MRACAVPGSESDLDRSLLALLRARRRVYFTDLATLLPGYTWRALFSALIRLQQQGQVELSPLRWDYELSCVGSMEHSAGAPESETLGSGLNGPASSSGG